MARILRSETSLQRRQRAIVRELSLRKPLRWAIWCLTIALLVWGACHAWRTGTWIGLVLSGFAVLCAAGYEVHLREIVAEHRNLEGGRRGERRMAERLAEQLANDHIIINDLDFRIAHERFQIDHLVLAPSAIYIIESKFWAGTLSGDIRDTQWLQSRANGRGRSVKSPVLQAERQRRMFIAQQTTNIPDDRIYALAVFTHPAVQLNITGTQNQEKVFRVQDAIRFINDRCFDPPILTPDQLQQLADTIIRRQA
ncbi:MAG: NERD domain-containing protein [Lentisphaerae bacterium]|jgi:hypothetical protein|nr:NERD domain-containing protein [Lentisphaerota bacterium]